MTCNARPRTGIKLVAVQGSVDEHETRIRQSVQGVSVGYHIGFREITHGTRGGKRNWPCACSMGQGFSRSKGGLTAKPLEIGIVSPPQIRICRSHTEALCCSHSELREGRTVQGSVSVGEFVYPQPPRADLWLAGACFRAPSWRPSVMTRFKQISFGMRCALGGK